MFAVVELVAAVVVSLVWAVVDIEFAAQFVFVWQLVRKPAAFDMLDMGSARPISCSVVQYIPEESLECYSALVTVRHVDMCRFVFDFVAANIDHFYSNIQMGQLVLTDQLIPVQARCYCREIRSCSYYRCP